MRKNIKAILLVITAIVILQGMVYAQKLEKAKLKGIMAVPNKVKIEQGTSEEDFRKLFEVRGTFKGVKGPVVITDYETDYEKYQDKLGTYSVNIRYTHGKITKCTAVCTTICEKPTPPPTPTQIRYVGGYEDGTFRPDNEVTREELASMLARLISNGKVPPTPNPYKDLDPARYSTNDIAYVTKLGIFKPNEKSIFNPAGVVSKQDMLDVLENIKPYLKEQFNEDDILLPEKDNYTRAETVTLLNKIFRRIYKIPKITNPYKDVTEDYWAYKDIICASFPQ